MKRFHVYLLAMAIAASSGGLFADTTMHKSSDAKTADNLQRIGSTLADEATAGNIRASLAKAGNDGLSENGFGALLSDLAKADRERIGDFKGQKMDDLNRAIAQFKSDFKAKYNQEFDLKPEHFKDVLVYAGADKNSATVSIAEETFLGKPLDMKQLDTTTSNVVGKDATSISDKAITGSKTPPTETTLTDTTTIEKNKTELPSSGNILTLNMANDMGGWKINIPDQIMGEQLKGNLTKHIQMLDDQKATWPSDVTGAYHAAAFHVLQALTDSSLASDR